ncbi:hypothetical protein DYH09_10225 [bacterium CPR1]|nr:hypothetical protein [bacterium CPR1]
MEKIVHLARSFEEADDWDIRQCLEMTPEERMEAARILKARLYPEAEDVRDCLRDPSKPLIFRKMLRNSSGCSIISESDS